ncbi:MAG: DUF4838 domain-containing protein [Clostridia bacterium]|nr:DUF4838 domain-containing protein [Clostridia bacterium]
MKKTNKLISILLGVFLALSCAACGTQTKTVTTSDREQHYAENTLHKVDVKDSKVPFVVNQQTSYKIYADNSNPNLSAAINKSAGFVTEHVLAATGAELEYSNEKPNLTESSYAIVYGHRDVFESFGLTMPNEDLGSSGYYIKTKGNVVFIEANGNDGYRMGGLAFLREVIGYDMLSESCVVYGRDASTMPIMDVVEKPDFTYRQIQNMHTSVEVYGMGMHKHDDIWSPVEGWDMHNSLYYIPVEIYGEAHPDWYRADKTQPCYTAHGNKPEYEAMLDAVFKVIEKRMAECPTLENISFTTMDAEQDSCTCETCLEYRSLYGTPAAACIYFMNDLNKIVQAHVREAYDNKRIMNLTFFAYHDHEPAPVERQKITDALGNVTWGDAIKDENGNYMPLKRYAMDENRKFIKENGEYVYERDEDGNYVYLLCDEHVSPWLAPIFSKFTSSYYDDVNKMYAENVALWYTVSQEVYLWVYGTNFSYYLFPYNTWSSMVETYRYLQSCGVQYIWAQGQERNQSTAFSHLKDYIDSKYFFNVNTEYNKVLDTYFSNYFLDAGPHMRKLFNLIQAKSAYIEQTVITVTGGIYDDISKPEYWPRFLIEEMLRMLDDAYKAVEPYKATDPALYQNLIRRIKQESIFPRYVQCMYYGDYYPNIRALRESFRNDWNELGFSVYRETNGDMQSVFTNDWGL